MKIYVCHSCGYDYKGELYKPLRASSLNGVHEIFLPHEGDNAQLNTTQTIKDSDIVIAEVSFPATGLGIELGRAEVFGKRVLCLHKKGIVPNRSLTFVSSDFLEYSDSDDMIEKVSSFINAL